MKEDFIKLPRLYVDQELKEGSVIGLPEGQLHYLKNVMRRSEGDKIRLFDGHNGEWVADITLLSKKAGQATPVEQIKEQPETGHNVRLYFAPIKKQRLEWLIEKAVELGVTHFHPVMTQNTENRKLNEERMKSAIIEAAEQCERLTVPALEQPVGLAEAVNNIEPETDFLACIERFDAPFISEKAHKNKHIAFLIGPEGGFTEEEKKLIEAPPVIIPVSLGDNILRAETAVCFALAAIMAKKLS